MNRAIALVQSDAEAVLSQQAGRLSALRGQHIFISGGTGFVGTWLLELVRVLNEIHGFGTRVTIFSRGAKAFGARLPHLAGLPWLRVEEGDIRYIAELPRDVTFVVHAAALTDRRLFASQPSTVAEVNSLGTLKLLRAANLLEDVQKIVLLSSGLVTGAQPWELPRIDENHAGPLRCNDAGVVYAESKRFAEVIAHCAASESKLPVVIVRPFAFVGPYQSLQLPWAVTDFMRDGFTGGPLRIMGDGTTVRSIMYASDYAYGVLLALAAGQPRRTYNLGSPEEIDLMSLAKAIGLYFSPAPEIRTRVGQTGHERNRLVPDISRIQNELGFRSTVPLNQALQRAIDWHRLQRG